MGKKDSIRISEKCGVKPFLGLCPGCGNENGEIMLIGYIPDNKEAPKYAMTLELCDKCKEEYVKKGYCLLVEKKNDTDMDSFEMGRTFWMKREIICDEVKRNSDQDVFLVDTQTADYLENSIKKKQNNNETIF